MITFLPDFIPARHQIMMYADVDVCLRVYLHIFANKTVVLLPLGNLEQVL